MMSLSYDWIHDVKGVIEKLLPSLLSVKARDLEKGEINKRCPLDLMLVVDRSGSMDGRAFAEDVTERAVSTRLDAVKAALIELFPKLCPFDRLGIVLFDTDVEVLFPLTECTDENVRLMKEKINEMSSRNMTNISGGLLKGLELLSERKEKDSRSSALLLFTDGEANQGIRDPEMFRDLLAGNIQHESVNMTRSLSSTSTNGNILAEYREQQKEEEKKEETRFIPQMKNYIEGDDKVSIFTFGFGSDHSDKLMTSISKIGSGKYYFIENESQAVKRAFLNCLGGLLSIMCKKIIITLTPYSKDSIRIRRVRTWYESSMDETDGSHRILIPYLKATESRDMMIQLEFAEGMIVLPGTKLFSIQIEYVDRNGEQKSCPEMFCIYRKERKKKGEDEGEEENILSNNNNDDYYLSEAEKMIKIEEFEIRTKMWMIIGDLKDKYLPGGKYEECKKCLEEAIQKIDTCRAKGTKFCIGLRNLAEKMKEWFVAILEHEEENKRRINHKLLGLSQRFSVFYETLLNHSPLKEFEEEMMKNFDIQELIKKNYSSSRSYYHQLIRNDDDDDVAKKSHSQVTVTIPGYREAFEYMMKKFHCQYCAAGFFVEPQEMMITHKCRGKSRCANYTRKKFSAFNFRCTSRVYESKGKRGKSCVRPCTMEIFKKWRGSCFVSKKTITLGMFKASGDSQEEKEKDYNDLIGLLKEVGFDEKGFPPPDDVEDYIFP